jgi:pyridoxine/pyridoxamine 5'-phosphate oxidase
VAVAEAHNLSHNQHGMRLPASYVRGVLRDAIKRNGHTSRYVQLATIGLDGYPAVRTVVQRGFVEGAEEGDNFLLLKFVTDGRSRKVTELAANAKVEVCWYFTSHEQFRLRGTMTVRLREREGSGKRGGEGDRGRERGRERERKRDCLLFSRARRAGNEGCE